MNFDSILIITYGRSGSTLLQGILNSIDGILIRGENYNFCYHLFQSWQSITKSKAWYSPTAQNPWYGSHLLNERLFLSQCKKLVYVLLLADRMRDQSVKCYGFKEIRYNSFEIGNDFEDYLKFLYKIFPNVGFIFNTRKLENVAQSMWWAKQEKSTVMKTLSETENSFFEFIKGHPKNTYHIAYEDVISKSDKLQGMFDFIGACYNEQKIDEILSIPHSFLSNNSKAVNMK